MNKKKAALLILPNVLGVVKHPEVFLPKSVFDAVESLDGLIAESEGGGRRYLGMFNTSRPAHQIPLALFNKNTSDNDIDFLLEPMTKGERWGYVSDAGLPCIADPGSMLVDRARKLGIQVRAFIGPSSILLTLMLSGLSGQNFAFNGYLPKGEADLQKKIKALEERARKEKSTQVFIEAPHRNQRTLESLIETLSDETVLCVAWDLTLPTQGILSQPVKLWKRSPLPNLNKRVATFCLA